MIFLNSDARVVRDGREPQHRRRHVRRDHQRPDRPRRTLRRLLPTRGLASAPWARTANGGPIAGPLRSGNGVVVSTRAAVERGAFEQALRDRGAADYDDWYRRTKGVAFDRRSAPCSVGGQGTRVESSTSAPGPVASRTRCATCRSWSRSTSRSRACAGWPTSPSRDPTPVLGDATAVPLQSGACDLVVSCQVLQHLDAARLTAALRECAVGLGARRPPPGQRLQP